jgi:hypothetical protein
MVIQKTNLIHSLAGHRINGVWCKALKTRSGFHLAAISISTSSVWPLHSKNRFFSRRKPALEGVLQLTHDQVASFAQHYQWIDVHETIGWSIYTRQVYSTSCCYWAVAWSWTLALCRLAADVALCFTKAAKFSHGNSVGMGWLRNRCGESSKLYGIFFFV